MEHGVGRFRSLVLLLSFATGATSLAPVVMWTRMVHSVVGNGPFSVAMVFSASMLGLGLGGAVLGRVAGRRQRPIVLYGWLEICIGLYALGFPLTAAWASIACGWFYRAMEPGPTSVTGACLGMSLAVLPGMFFIGGTLPVLGRLMSDRHLDGGQGVAYLYGVTMLGAAVGCFLSVFLLLPAAGVRESLVLGGCSAVGLGALALGLGRGIVLGKDKRLTRRDRRSHQAEDVQMVQGKTFGLVLFALGVACSCSLACIVLWRCVLVYTVTASVYSWATILMTFLAGIAIGVCLSARFIAPRLRGGVFWFGLAEMLVSFGIVVSVWLLAFLPGINGRLFAQLVRRGGWCLFLARFAETSVVVFAPALLMGAALAIVLTVCLRGEVSAGRRIGQAQAVSVIGSLLGWLVAGFVLLPVLGALNGLLSVMALNLAAGVFLIGMASAWSVRMCTGATLAAAIVVVGSLLAIPGNIFYETFNMNHELSRLVWVKEGPGGTVTAHELPDGERVLAIDGIDLAGSDLSLRMTEKLGGYIPLCFHRDPKRILQMGFGCGETARIVLEFGIREYTIIENNNAVFDAADHFKDINHGSHEDEQIRKVVTNGKGFARLSGEMFDIIINDVASPGIGGRSGLLTVEHFSHCRRLLRAGGVLSCRVPLDIPPGELFMILAGLRDVFPHASIWLASNCLDEHCLLLGSLSPLRIDFRHVSAVMHRDGISKGLAEIEIHDVYDLLDCHVCDEAAIGRILEYVERNAGNRQARHTENLPLLELSAARRVSSEVYRKQSLSVLAAHHWPVTGYVMNFADEERDRGELARRFEATRHILNAHICELSGLVEQRRKNLTVALKANPGEAAVGSCEAELERRIRDLQQAVAAMPEEDAIAQRLADKLFIALRYPEAAEIYERLVGMKWPPSPNAFVNLAGIRFSDGKVGEAEGLLRRCLDRWPDSAEAHDRLGGIYFRMGRVNAARYHASRALRIEPTNSLYRQRFQQVAEIR